MKKEHNDPELYEILHFKPETSTEVQDKINNAYEQIKNGKTDAFGKRKHRARFYLASAAAVIFFLGFLGFSNPALAGKIPFIGRIFELVGDKLGYPGDFREHSVPLTDPKTDNDQIAPTDENTDTQNNNAPVTDTDPLQTSVPETDEYSQTAGDITITFSEACYTEMALYFSLEIYSAEGFPEDLNRVKNMEGYILSYDVLNMQCSQNFDFSQADPALYDTDILSCTPEEGLPTPYSIEGNYVDSHTFLGVIRVDLATIRDILNVETLPPEFVYSINIERFWGSLNSYKEVPATDQETNETHMIQVPEKKHYSGPWEFTVPVSIDKTDTMVKEIMETNADGVGISKVTKTPYEIKADIILPDNVDSWDYIVVITDADGKILDSQGNIVEIYSTYGRNTDTVHVYVMDYLTFADECKAENASLLPEKALFQTTIEW